ncbi:L-seryl-tRNA(Sec) kinase [Anolis carolinensis]|uniref:Phosphoseryl-tRNA kinase n=1 Tax=Anolis carolinensis TaxID=28377 RepID=G1KTY6_ANOCA|nr:PREDICTED: L-seryl-tRNA(Sec) kinase [Anolis carolinensis]|eukprot:XP_016847706.1 PREDICTED: L-seryl-tRNA(Sec) kinase [Anolis carolinensis]
MTQELQNGRFPQLGLCLLCGLPAAGKTTTAQVLSQSVRKHKGWQCVLLTYDDLIPMEAFIQMEGPEEQQSLMGSWRLYRQELLLCLEHFLQALITGCHYSPQNITETTWERFVCCLKEQGLISVRREDSASCQYLIDFTSPSPIYFVLDDNFYYRSMRYEVYQLARQYTLGFCQLFLDCQVEVCLERNSQRKQPLPEETIYAMAQKIECPNPEKYTWEHHSLILKSAGSALEDNLQMLDLLSAALENPVKPLEENTELKEIDRAICATSALHQTDQAIRRIVSQTMKNAKDNNVALCELRSLAEELNRLKLKFLEGLRHKSNEENQCCLQNNTFNINVTSAFSQEADDIVKKYLNKK